LFFILILIFSIFANRALKKKDSKLKVALLDFVEKIDKNLTESFHNDKDFARSFFPLIG
jgi:F0F1-type ATP synthase membrane subunit a